MKRGHAYRSLKLVHIHYVREDEFSMINVKTPREILSKYTEYYGKKVADRVSVCSLSMAQDTLHMQLERSLPVKVKHSGLTKPIIRFLSNLAYIETLE